MRINALELCNFRNYDRSSFEFHENTNVLYGDNAQGKTNVLESIFIAGTTKSHLGSKDREMIQMGQEESHIRMKVEKHEKEHIIDIHLKKNSSKGIAIDGLTTRKSSDLFGLINIIFFSPEDLSIIKNGPSERRRFLNIELCQLNKVYLRYLSKYNKILMQRNNLLKQISFNQELMDTLEVWDNQLVECGKYIIQERKRFLEQLNPVIHQKHLHLSGETEHLSILYEPSVDDSLFEEKLFLSRDKDLFLKTTNVGPHRDDMMFVIDEKDLRKYGSQGQKRTAALSLKLSEIEIVKEIVKEEPVLLLDDVLSELDRKRQNFLLDSIKGVQTIITCTGLEEFIESKMNIDRTFEIVNGSIRRMK